MTTTLTVIGACAVFTLASMFIDAVDWILARFGRIRVP